MGSVGRDGIEVGQYIRRNMGRVRERVGPPISVDRCLSVRLEWHEIRETTA